MGTGPARKGEGLRRADALCETYTYGGKLQSWCRTLKSH